MQITKGEIKKIIAEEMELLQKEDGQFDSLLEEFLSAYSIDENHVSKEALVDFLEVLEENKISKDVFSLLATYFPREKTATVLKEVLSK